jgi:hypothetical protein
MDIMSEKYMLIKELRRYTCAGGLGLQIHLVYADLDETNIRVTCS